MNNLSRRKFLLGSAALASLASLKGCAINKAAAATGLKDVYKNDFLIGTAISNQTLATNNQTLLDLISREFNAITAENCMKAGLIQPTLGDWQWELADRFVEYGVKHNMEIVGHTLVWHSQPPADMFVDAAGERVSRDELMLRMETHIKAVMGRYGEKIGMWDVVNEAIDEDKGWRKSPWYEIIGPEFMEQAFRLAHQMNPNAHLMYNDYNMHNPGKREILVDILKDYKQRSVPIHGIGMQGHVGLDYPDMNEFEASIEAYAEQGMKVHITELEVDVLPAAWEHMGAEISTEFAYSEELNPFAEGLPGDVQEQLTERYVELFKLFIKHRDKIARVTTWGTHDAESWKNDFPVRGRTNYPLLFNRDLEPKPAYYGVANLRR